ncbi:hypothetical protein MJO28_015739 [Puccinia striiformis f. sp. tritici]|uniref:Uncharacterized protein n=1 Tax=Puccinia striiformis f. sp. tritici TaxID=168172 RepID=A0ACC0DRI1_9BASI|nr:hypothetical protein MJO28_015739 [Puccinia striiformis f. sp. tritici]
MPHISSQLDYNSLTPLPEANDPSIVAYIFAQPALTYPNQNVSEKVYKNEMWIPNRNGGFMFSKCRASPGDEPTAIHPYSFTSTSEEGEIEVKAMTTSPTDFQNYKCEAEKARPYHAIY